MAVLQAGQAREGRVLNLAAVFQFLLVEAVIIMEGGKLDGVMIGIESLNDGPPPQRTAPGAPHNLREELKTTFTGAIIRKVEAHIRQNHAHEGDQGQV